MDPCAADALILSHGHRDHYGPLPTLARVELPAKLVMPSTGTRVLFGA